MEFVTIHDLSRELNIAARVIRYRLINLIVENKLKEGDDFRRDEYKDDQHYVWKINPLSFMRETGLKRATPLPTKNDSVVTKPITTDNKSDNQPLPTVNQTGNNPPPVGNEPTRPVTKPDNEPVAKSAGPSLEREMIDLLKDQIQVKDGQIEDLGEQLKETHGLNLKLTGTMLSQAQEIKNLLQLTGGKMNMAEFVTKDTRAGNKVDNQTGETVTDVGNDIHTSDNKTGQNSVMDDHQTGSQDDLRRAA